MTTLIHDSNQDPVLAKSHAIWLHELLNWLLEYEVECQALVSLKACLDIINHYHSDMVRHLGHQKNGIDPAKHVAYLCFWVRKIKPVSDAYYRDELKSGNFDDDSIVGQEIHDINERVSLLLARYLLRRLALTSKLGQSAMLGAEQELRVVEYFDMYMFRSAEATEKLKNNFEQYVYDMRYRTFGPHHLTNLVKHAIFHATTQSPIASCANG